MPTLITTSRKPDDFGRRLARILSHVIPNSKRINRGNANLQRIFEMALEQGYDKVIIVRTKFGHTALLDFYTFIGEEFKKEERMLQLKDVIDHKIYGWKRIPGGAPASTSRAVEEINPELMNLLEDRFEITYDRKTSIGILLDKDENTTYLTLIDMNTQKPFFFAKVRVVR
ncbi:MAG: hypothetical protein D6732_11540 [Methanobacteriota archaeon]|nr:MAG: hypothetical protein D6732_11540 [Euryarchaeota archaeon]